MNIHSCSSNINKLTSARVETVSKGESKSVISPATSLKKDLACAASLLILEAADLRSSLDVKLILRRRRLFCSIAVMYFRATRSCAVVITSSKLDGAGGGGRGEGGDEGNHGGGGPL